MRLYVGIVYEMQNRCASLYFLCVWSLMSRPWLGLEKFLRASVLIWQVSYVTVSLKRTCLDVIDTNYPTTRRHYTYNVPIALRVCERVRVYVSVCDLDIMLYMRSGGFREGVLLVWGSNPKGRNWAVLYCPVIYGSQDSKKIITPKFSYLNL